MTPVPAETGHTSWRWCWARWGWRGLALVLGVALAWPLASWPAAALIPAATSPFIMIGAAIATRAPAAATLVGLPFLVLILIRPRGFCRYVCPVGLLIDLTGAIPARLRRWTHLPDRACPATGDALETAPCRNPAPGTSPLQGAGPGQWIALLTLGGAIVGWPWFLWLDPMALFSGFFALGHPPRTLPALAAALGLPVLLALSVFRRNLWCGRLCPLGGLQDFSSALRRSLSRPPPAGLTPPNGPRLARRSALALGLAALGTLAARKAFGAKPGGLRPPGAAAEPDFSARCVRCGSCVRVCPSHLLHPDTGEHGVAGLLAPVLRFEGKYCHENCCRCGQVCPSGAIRRITPAEKPKTVIGRPELDYSLCRLFYLGSDCSGCVDACPYEAITLAGNEDDYRTKPIVSADRCNGCGACEVACPATPKALVVRRH